MAKKPKTPKPVKTLRITIHNDETGEELDVQRITDGWTMFVNGCFKIVSQRQVGKLIHVTLENSGLKMNALIAKQGKAH